MQTTVTASEQNLTAGNTFTQVDYAEAQDAFQRNTKWWSVFAAFNLNDFKPSPIWIAQKVGISIEEVVEALDGLSALGYLTKDNGAFYPVKGKDFINFNWGNKTKTEIIDEHAIVSQQILNDLNTKTLFAYDHRFLAGNEEILTELYADIKNAFDKAFAKSQQTDNKNNNAIFKITFTGVNVVKNNNSNEEGQ